LSPHPLDAFPASSSSQGCVVSLSLAVLHLKVEREEATNSELNTHFWTLNPPQEEGLEHFALFTVTEVRSLKAH